MRAVDHCTSKRPVLARLGIVVVVGGSASLGELARGLAKQRQRDIVGHSQVGDHEHFSIVTDSKFKGSFNVDWSLYPGNWEQDFIKGNAYNFHAIVRHLDANGSMIGLKADDENPNVVEGRYMVLPLEGGDGLITGIDAVAAADSEWLA